MKYSWIHIHNRFSEQEEKPDNNENEPETDESNLDNKVFENQDGCGRKGAGSIRIVGGSQIRRHEYPWLCSLRRLGGHICGITLLSVYPKDTILVGAAHCYKKACMKLV